MDDKTAPPDDLDYRNPPGTRVTYQARQRATDRTTWLHLALHLPAFLLSLALVLAAALVLEAWLGVPAWLPTALWTASGALTFHRPSEQFLARHLLRLHRPLPADLATLTPVWHEVTARAGVDGRQYELWIEESSDLNALAAAGHIVAVTRRALEQLPTTQLAAVLAHELGHHVGGHAWSGLLGWWYGMPGRLAWRGLARATPRLLRTARGARYTSTTVSILLAIGIWLTFTALTATYALPLLLLVLPYLTAAVSRRAELRADAHAAVLGFGPALAQTLHGWSAHETGTPATPGMTGLQVRLLSTHPDHRTRLHHLQPYLQSGR
ncbi:M48 family metalloprotease [Streptomyces xanthophaeus]|uniref:M48 family metalloprotease n=1 Tax=Streptomyces xanthophaeus TaxID=67385 RepID=UPI00386AAE99|nr:M48 family metalloprotease [Streptomyces xanthophaeus]WST60900.1 M48 family metalloprotease [Streptomyces xanthophaeus]